MYLNLVLYFVSFIGIWFGAGLAVKSVRHLSAKLGLSSFTVSFLLLGFFTSISELSVGINSVLSNNPEIYVGNLVGASIVLFMLIIPLLAITGKQVRIHEELRGKNLVFSLFVIALPVLLVLDGITTKIDAWICILAFAICTIQVQTKQGLLEKLGTIIAVKKLQVGKELFRMVAGTTIIFFASKLAVEQTLFFANELHLSPFMISLLVISIGTNLPELSFVFRSLFMRNNQVALGNYVGSAAVNTFLFGVLTLFYGKNVVLQGNYALSLFAMVFGLILFYFFTQSKKVLSRLEGFLLLALYAVFLFTEYFFSFRSQLLTIL